MQQLTIHFKNGETKKVPIEVIEALNNNLVKTGGTVDWQSFSDENNKIFLMLNISQIVYID